MKTCTKCKVDKELVEFSKSKNSKDGLSYNCKQCRGNWYLLNKDNIQSKNQGKKEYLREYNKSYYFDNIEKVQETQKNWRLSNKDEIKSQQNNKYQTDPIFRISKIVRSLTYRSLKYGGYSKRSKTYKILGCTFEEFKLYIESLFEPWMNWDNQGNPKDRILEFNKTWDLDHIIPISSGISEEEILKLSHFSNYQPLCSKYNREIKRNSLTIIK